MDTKINILIWEKLLISTQFCAPHSCENNIPQSKKHKIMLQIRKSNNITTFFSMLEPPSNDSNLKSFIRILKTHGLDQQHVGNKIGLEKHVSKIEVVLRNLEK
jgi:hypothetical protein